MAQKAGVKPEESAGKGFEITNQIDSSDYEDGEYEEVAVDEYYDSDDRKDEEMMVQMA